MSNKFVDCYFDFSKLCPSRICISCFSKLSIRLREDAFYYLNHSNIIFLFTTLNHDIFIYKMETEGYLETKFQICDPLFNVSLTTLLYSIIYNKCLYWDVALMVMYESSKHISFVLLDCFVPRND